MSNSPVNFLPPTSGIIDFNALPLFPEPNTTSYQEDGFLVTNPRGMTGPFVFNMVGNSVWPTTVSVTYPGGGNFNIVSLEVSEANSTMPPTDIVFTGLFADGSSLRQTHTTSPTFAKETVNLTGFNGLTELRFDNANAFDNLVWSAPLTVDQDTTLEIRGISVNDVDGNLKTTELTVDNGTLSVALSGGATVTSGANNSANLVLSGSQTQINAALATLAYQGIANYSGADILTVLSTDGAGTPLTDTDQVPIDVREVDRTAIINTVPLTFDATTLNFNNSVGTAVYTEGDFQFITQSSGFTGPLALGMVGTGTPSTVTVTSLSGGSFDAASILVSEENSTLSPQVLHFTGTLAAGGTVSQHYTTLPSFERELVTLNGFKGLSSLAFTTRFTGFDELVLSSALVTNEDTALAIEGISVADVNGLLETTQLTVEHGTITVDLSRGAEINGGSNGSDTLGLSGSTIDINAALATVSYQGDANFNGMDTLTVTSMGSPGSPAIDTDDILINVVSVSDVPEISRATGTVGFGGISGITPGPYVENGFRFTTTAGNFTGPFSLGMAGSHEAPYTLIATTVEGSAFNAESIQVSEESSTLSPQTVIFTGVRAGGSTVTQSYITSPNFTREQVELEGFEEIVELRMQTGATSFDDFTFSRSQSFTLAENSANGTIVGLPSATDGDSDTLQNWTIVGGNGQGIFSIDDATGAIKAADATQLNFETNASFTLDLTVSDGVNTSGVETVVVNLTDVNEVPVLDLNGPNNTGSDYYTGASNAYFSAAVSSLSIVEDAEDTLMSASAVITTPLNGADEFLSAQTAGTAITATYDPVEGILQLVGEASAATYEQVLRTMQYTNTAGVIDGDDRTLEFTINDGEFLSFATSTLNFTLQGGTPTADIIKGRNESEIISGFEGNDTLRGRGGDDHLKGGAGNDRLFGDAGADHLDGGEGIDIVNYAGSAEAVTVDLSTNTANGGDATGDTLNSIERVVGSNFNDTLIGDDQKNTLIGLAGADVIDGGDNVDTVNYLLSDAAITIDLGNNSAAGGHATGDILNNMERVFGSNFDDMLFGDDGKNTLVGFGGADVLDGGKGNDILDGRTGADTMTGGIGSDTFVVKTLTDSLLTDFDIITDLKIGKDRIKAKNALSSAQINQLGAVNTLTETDLQAVLTEVTFLADEAATFTLGNRTFLAINDAQNSYSASEDAIVEITGFSGELAALTTI